MTSVKPILLLAATAAFVASPFVSRNFAGYDPALFPVRIDDPAVQPAGYAFAIWSVIYVWLIVHAVFGLWKRSDDAAWDAPRWPLILSLGVGATWLEVATVAPVAATVIIWIMVGAAITALARADARTDRWLLAAPIAMYSGWLTAASAVSLGVVLSGHGILTDTSAAVAMLLLVLAIAVPVQRRVTPSPLYGATVIWALIAIIVRDLDSHPIVALIAAAGILIMLAAILLPVRSRAVAA
jgi:hypothetical protein